MKFINYGTFFGMSAIHALFANDNQINRLLRELNYRAYAKNALSNLAKELLALKAIFDPKVTDKDIPHISLVVDTQAEDTKYFLKGLNNFFYYKDHKKISSATIDEDPIDDISLDMDDTDIEDSLSMSDGLETAVFVDTNVNDSDDSADFDMDFSDLDDLEQVDESTLAESPQESIDLCEDWYLDLITWGKAEPDIRDEDLSFRDAMRKLKTEYKDTDEFSSIIAQKDKLPMKPFKFSIPQALAAVTKDIAVTDDEVDIFLKFAEIIHSRMSEKIQSADENGELKSRIDVILHKIDRILHLSNTDSRQILCKQASDYIYMKDAGYGSPMYITYVSSVMDNGFKNRSEMQLKHNLRSILADCDELLEKQANEQATLNQPETIIENLTAQFDTAAPSFLNHFGITPNPDSINFLHLLIFGGLEYDNTHHSHDIISKLMQIPENIPFIFTFYAAMSSAQRNMLEAIATAGYKANTSENTDPQIYLLDFFKKFSAKTGIIGVYYKYMPAFLDMLYNNGEPIARFNPVTLTSDEYSVCADITDILRGCVQSMQHRFSRRRSIS